LFDVQYVLMVVFRSGNTKDDVYSLNG